jgi:predicted ribosomally synthesized peptide with nif11-like leader
MSEEQFKAFMDAIKSDVGLQEQLKEAVDADGVVAIAKAAGFVISAEELKRAQSELSEEELEGAVGGVCWWKTQCGQGADNTSSYDAVC